MSTLLLHGELKELDETHPAFKTHGVCVGGVRFMQVRTASGWASSQGPPIIPAPSCSEYGIVRHQCEHTDRWCSGKLDIHLGDGGDAPKVHFPYQFIQSNLAQEISQSLIAWEETTNSCTSELIIRSVLLITAEFQEREMRAESTRDCWSDQTDIKVNTAIGFEAEHR